MKWRNTTSNSNNELPRVFIKKSESSIFPLSGFGKLNNRDFFKYVLAFTLHQYTNLVIGEPTGEKNELL